MVSSDSESVFVSIAILLQENLSPQDALARSYNRYFAKNLGPFMEANPGVGRNAAFAAVREMWVTAPENTTGFIPVPQGDRVPDGPLRRPDNSKTGRKNAGKRRFYDEAIANGRDPREDDFEVFWDGLGAEERSTWGAAAIVGDA
ncbi:hypothetical protein FB45DRAFT_896895 [Roridomyces roridus]|uniref:Uncharacterized protein n=1 Tax=Roridomyces roridus TaxID=1738132 RepID=A0AAD7CB31_9AGAR|nr:hypothetical protein FB45DRAFT_896895 [Roridomyces roridus]